MGRMIGPMGSNGEIFRAMRAVRDSVWGLFGSFV